jgi:hypothetical protein
MVPVPLVPFCATRLVVLGPLILHRSTVCVLIVVPVCPSVIEKREYVVRRKQQIGGYYE